MIQNPIISFSNNSDQQLISDSFSFYGEQGIANYPEIKQFIQLQTGETAMYSGQIIQPIRFSQSPTFTGITDSVIKVGEMFDPLAHVHAHDAEDGDITKNIVVSGTVDTMKSGVYVLTYSVTDSVGNLVEVTRTITVRQELISIQTIPTLTFIQKEISLKVGDRFDASMWITVSDPLTDIEIIENTVNTAVPGRYVVTYRVTGLNGSSSTATLIVNVDRRNNPTENTNSVSDESILIVESEETQTTKTNNSMTPLKEKEVTLLKTGFEVFELSLLIGGVAVIASLLVTKNKRPYLDNNKTDTH